MKRGGGESTIDMLRSPEVFEKRLRKALAAVETNRREQNEEPSGPGENLPEAPAAPANGVEDCPGHKRGRGRRRLRHGYPRSGGTQEPNEDTRGG